MNRTTRRLGTIACGILAALSVLMPSGKLFAGSAPSFIAANGSEQSLLTYNNVWAVSHGDTVNGHAVVGSGGLSNGCCASTTTFYGNNNGQSLQCTTRAVRLTDGATFAGGSASTTVNGVFSMGSTISYGGTSIYATSVWCFIPKVSGGKAAQLFGF